MEKHEYVFTKNTMEEVIEQLKEFKKLVSDKKFPNQKIKVKFINEVSIYINKRKTKTVKEADLVFFTYSEGKRVAYSSRINPRKGYPVDLCFLRNLKSFAISKNNDLKSLNEENTKKLLGKFHPNLWNNIKEELSKDLSLMETKYYNEFKTINISGKFPKDVIDRLKEAIEKKENYSHKKYGTKRDLSVEVKLCEDGILRAWYSSEYAGCGNGSYYLLISPTVAGFREDD